MKNLSILVWFHLKLLKLCQSCVNGNSRYRVEVKPYSVKCWKLLEFTILVMKNWKVPGKLQNHLIDFLGYWEWGIPCHSIQEWDSLWGHFEWGWKWGQSDLATRQEGPFAPWARTPHNYWHYSWSISTHFHWNRQVTCT